MDFHGLVHLVRFPLMDYITLFEVVEPTKLLTPDEMLDVLSYASSIKG